MISFFSKLFQFVKNKTFVLNLVFLLIVIFVIVFGTLIYLDSFTRFGQKIEVPNFVGDKVNIADIDEYLMGKEIGYEVLDSVYRTDIPSGTIFFQQPGPTDETGVHVKEGRKIKFRVATHYQLVEMPALAGKTSRRFAEQILINRGLKPVIEFESSIEGRDQVLEQKFKGKPIASGEKIPVGSKVVLVVSKGPSQETVSVPNLIGLTISTVNERLSLQNLSAYVLCDDCPNEESKLQAFVYKQSPTSDEGSFMPAGGAITVWVSMTQQQTPDN